MKGPSLKGLRNYRLRRRLGVLHIWATGVGTVITGEYFGWNLALSDNGPLALLLAVLTASVLYLSLSLSLTEMSVAMPTAGGPFDLGRRAAGPFIGFLIGWSMLIGFQFAALATAIATGSYISFLIGPENPYSYDYWAAIAVVVAVFLIQIVGVREQATAMFILVVTSVMGLGLFWIIATPRFSLDLLSSKPISRDGLVGIIRTLPYGVWVLAGIETAVFAAEEATEPATVIPRGVLLAGVTLITTALLTCTLACGSVPYQLLALKSNGNLINYPLAEAVHLMGVQPRWLVGLLSTFGACSMLASYHGIVFAASRQALSMARIGYLPEWMSYILPKHRTPLASLIVTSCITCLFIGFNARFKHIVNTALLVSTFSALAWYIMVMICFLQLRNHLPKAFFQFHGPGYPAMPLTAILLAFVTLLSYVFTNFVVFWIATPLYILGLILYYRQRRVHLSEWNKDSSYEMMKRTNIESDIVKQNSTGLSDYIVSCTLSMLSIIVCWIVIDALINGPNHQLLTKATWFALCLGISAVSIIGSSAARLYRMQSNVASHIPNTKGNED